MRRYIDGLANIIKEQFKLNPFEKALFLFCGKRWYRIKALYYDENGFVLLAVPDECTVPE